MLVYKGVVRRISTNHPKGHFYVVRSPIGDGKYQVAVKHETELNNLEGDKKMIHQIAKTCHNVNKAYCESIGDMTQPTWDEAPEWQRKSAVNGVLFHLDGERSPDESHISWMKEKVEDGWVYGEVKDPIMKTHPCIVDYSALPLEQRTKDYLFKAVVDSFKAKAVETIEEENKND